MNRKGSPSPWGEIQCVTKHAEGIEFVSTASHGGFWLSRDRFSQLCTRLGKVPMPFTRDFNWWEEDCDAQIVVEAFPEIFKNGKRRGND